MIQPAFIRSRDVAALLGVRTSTLKRWRQLGKGPRGFAYLGETVVVYSRESVERFLESLRREANACEAFWRSYDHAQIRVTVTPPVAGTPTTAAKGE